MPPGSRASGSQRGDTIAIVGSNRPRLYWSVMAAQMLGAVPVPVYADAVADELAYVLAHADVRFAAVEDQEQVDKILSVSDRLPKLEQVALRRAARAARLRPRPPARDRRRHRGRPCGARHRTPAWANGSTARSQAGKGSDRSIILYTSGTTGQSKGVVLTAIGCINAASDTVAFDKLTERDEALAYLPLAWVGDHYLNYAQALVAAFCLACPESADTAMADMKEIGPTFFFAPPRVFEQMLTRVMIRMEDAEPDQAAHVPCFSRRRAPLRREDPQRRARAARRPRALRARRGSGLRAAQERARALARAHRLYRGRGDRARPVLVLSLDRAEPEAALRPDRSLPLPHRAARRENLCRHRRTGDAECRPAHRRERRGAVQVAGHVRGLFQGRSQDRRGRHRGRLRQDRRRRVHRSEDRPSQDHRPGQGRRPPQ